MKKDVLALRVSVYPSFIKKVTLKCYKKIKSSFVWENFSTGRM